MVNSKSTVAASNIIFGLFFGGFGEQIVRVTELNQLAQVHKRRVVRTTRSLLHVVGHDHDGVILF